MSPAARRSFFRTRLHDQFTNRAALDGRQAIDLMASDMRGLAAVTDQSVTRDDLQSIGWTAQQLDRHGAAARRAATAAASRSAG